jgi:hypothetical protein
LGRKAVGRSFSKDANTNSASRPGYKSRIRSTKAGGKVLAAWDMALLKQAWHKNARKIFSRVIVQCVIPFLRWNSSCGEEPKAARTIH